MLDSLRAATQFGTDSSRIDSRIELGKALLNSDAESGQAELRRAAAGARRDGDLGREGRAYAEIGRGYFLRGEPDSTIYWAHQARARLARAGDVAAVANADRLAGTAYLGMGDYSLAIQEFTRSASSAEQIGDDLLLAKALNNMGMAYREMSDYGRALDLYEKALRLKEGTAGPSSLASTWLNIGVTLLDMDRHSEALAPIAKADSLWGPGDGYNQGLVQSAYGTAYQRLGRNRAAEPYLRRAVDVFEGFGAASVLPAVYGNLAEVLYRTGREQEALRVMDRSLLLAEQSNSLELTVSAHELVSRVYASTGDFENAHVHLRLYANAAETLRGEAVAEAVGAAQAEYDTESARRDAAAEAQRAALAEARIDRQRAWLVGSLSALALLAALSASVWRAARLRRRANALLTEKNAEVERRRAEVEAALDRTAQLLGEREVLLREVHHRVKNNLQVVASLVNLQSDAVADDAARAALRQMRARVEAMALVHRRLYGDDLRTVDAADYLGDLARLLEGTYAWVGAELASDVDPVALDADTAVPLGLATAELVANAFEHGVPAGGGHVRLSLAEAPGGRLVLAVEDSGPGLPPDLAAPPDGSLGLQLASDLAVQLGGHFEMGRSERLGGARFALDVPYAVPAVAGQDGAAVPVPAPPSADPA